jgi:amino acid transporter
LNVRGVRAVADTGNILAVAKLIPLALFVLAGVFFLNPRNFSGLPLPGYHSFSQSVLLLVYAFTGFEMAVIPAGEVRNPERDLPKALMAGMGIVVATYISIQVVSIGTLPGLAHSQRPLADAAAGFLGTGGAVIVTAGIIVSLAGNLNVLILSASRLIYAMAKRGELPRQLARIHSRFRTPAAAVILTAAVMLALTLSGTFVYLVTLSVLSRLVTYFLTCGAAPVLRYRFRIAARFHLPGGMAVPAAGMAVILWLLSNTSLREAAAVIAATLAGLGAYWLSRRVRNHRLDRMFTLSRTDH